MVAHIVLWSIVPPPRPALIVDHPVNAPVALRRTPPPRVHIVNVGAFAPDLDADPGSWYSACYAWISWASWTVGMSWLHGHRYHQSHGEQRSFNPRRYWVALATLTRFTMFMRWRMITQGTLYRFFAEYSNTFCSHKPTLTWGTIGLWNLLINFTQT